MIARQRLQKRDREWNARWHAPFGSQSAKRVIPKRLWGTRIFAPVIGMFAFQPNNVSRRLEYPWAFHAARLEPGMRLLDVGAGFSGFPFVLSRCGMSVVMVDPLLDYGGGTIYKTDPGEAMRRMNAAFKTDVVLKHCTIDQAGLPSESFDRIFCISALEHIPADQQGIIAREIQRLLKPGGLCIVTIDLFLALSPFTTRSLNSFGTNISVRDFVESSGLTLHEGSRDELYGYPEFDADRIQSQLEEYFVSTPVPVLTQMLVLKK